MKENALNAFQVAALLVSASYGIGFLFGSGEMAMAHGMGGSAYGLATALGMLLLAPLAARLWRTGAPIWELFGRHYGAGLKNTVALLSVVWMAGVLAAQILGGVAIAQLLGVPTVAAYGLVLGAILVASRLELRLASTVFSFFLLLSALVLVYALVAGSGLAVYADSPRRLAADTASFEGGALFSLFVAIVALVCTGADYHQFVMAAKRPASAMWGCVLAALALALISPLPASLVIALQNTGALDGLDESRKVIPFALSQVARRLGPGLDSALLIGLSAAALGSGAAIVRAMTTALASATENISRATPARMSVLALALGGALAARGQGMVATMVSVNVIYLGAVGGTFAALLGGFPLSAQRAATAVGFGFTASFTVYLAAWAGLIDRGADLGSLGAGLVASGGVLAGPLVRTVFSEAR